MKKKTLVTLLSIALATTIMACGTSKEVPTSTTNEEVESPSIEEDTIEEETNEETNDEEVEVTDERPADAEDGKTYTQEWGTYTIVSNEDGFDNIEVNFNQNTFKASVPQDLGSKFSNGDHTLYILNDAETKMLITWFSTVSMNDKESTNALTKEEIISLYNGYVHPENGYFEKTWLSDNVLKFIFEATKVDEITQKEMNGYVFYIADFESGVAWDGYYGEDMDICLMGNTRFVAESFGFIDQEETSNEDTLGEFGLTGLDLGAPLTTINKNGNTLTIRMNDISFEDAKGMGKRLANVVQLYNLSGDEVDGTSSMQEDSPSPFDRFRYQLNDTWVNVDILYSADGVNIQVTIE